MRKQAGLFGMVAALALNCAEARAADAVKTAPATTAAKNKVEAVPDEELLEFLGSDDSDDEVWDEYLAETESERPAPEVKKDE